MSMNMSLNTTKRDKNTESNNPININVEPITSDMLPMMLGHMLAGHLLLERKLNQSKSSSWLSNLFDKTVNVNTKPAIEITKFIKKLNGFSQTLIEISINRYNVASQVLFRDNLNRHTFEVLDTAYDEYKYDDMML